MLKPEECETDFSPTEWCDVVILGGGLCGLYAAHKLTSRGLRALVLEKEPYFGGLAAGHRFGENWYDLGIHLFHETDREIFADFCSLLGSAHLAVAKDLRIRWGKRTYRYPLQTRDMATGFPLWRLVQFSVGLVYSQAVGKMSNRPPANAEEALVKLYGGPLYRFFFREFTERYWSRHPRELSAGFVSTKMPRLSAVDFLYRLVNSLGLRNASVRTTESALLNEPLHYSPSGAETLPRRLREVIHEQGGQLLSGCRLKRLLVESEQVTAVDFETSGSTYRVKTGHVISTIPICDLVTLIEPAASPDVVEAANALKYRAVVVYGLLVRKTRCFEGIAMYFRERIFHRVSEPKNAGLLVFPEDCTILLVEMTCEVEDEKWRGTEAARQRVLRDLEAEAICSHDDVIEMHVIRAETAYPIFALGFEASLERIMNWTASLGNLQSTGRQGAFAYPNMEGAMRMGARAAEKVLNCMPLAASA